MIFPVHVNNSSNISLFDLDKPISKYYIFILNRTSASIFFIPVNLHSTKEKMKIKLKCKKYLSKISLWNFC